MIKQNVLTVCWNNICKTILTTIRMTECHDYHWQNSCIIIFVMLLSRIFLFALYMSWIQEWIFLILVSMMLQILTHVCEWINYRIIMLLWRSHLWRHKFIKRNIMIRSISQKFTRKMIWYDWTCIMWRSWDLTRSWICNAEKSVKLQRKWVCSFTD